MLNNGEAGMTFELVRWGWPNAAAVVALAALPFMAVLLPAPKTAPSSQVEVIQADEPHPIGVASIAAE
jgi:hypothetical protein